jgi:hypothetical protein
MSEKLSQELVLIVCAFFPKLYGTQRSVYSAWPSFEHGIVHEPKFNLINLSSTESIPGHALYILLCVLRWVVIIHGEPHRPTHSVVSEGRVGVGG